MGRECDAGIPPSFRRGRHHYDMERVRGVEPLPSIWKTDALTLSYTRACGTQYSLRNKNAK